MRKRLLEYLIIILFIVSATIALSITYTTNLNLAKHDQGDTNWHTELNSNFDKVDSFLTLKRCRVYANAVQAIPTSAYTAIAFAAETYDTDNMHSNVTNNSRITIATTGFYVFKGQLILDAAAGGRRIAILYLNGAEIARAENTVVADATAKPSLIISTDYYCNASDYVQLIAYHTKGTDQNTVVGGVVTSYLMAVRIGF